MSFPRVGGRARDFNLQSSSFRAIGRRLGIARSTPASPVHERGRTSRLDPRESGRRRTRRAVVSASRRAVHRRRFTARLRRAFFPQNASEGFAATVDIIMSAGLGKGIGIPVKLLHEAEGHTVTVRTPEDIPRVSSRPAPDVVPRAARFPARRRSRQNLNACPRVDRSNPSRPRRALPTPLNPTSLPLSPLARRSSSRRARRTGGRCWSRRITGTASCRASRTRARTGG